MSKSQPISLLFILIFMNCGNSFGQHTKDIIYPNSKSGKLQYISYTDKGDIIPDFSYCGYHGGDIKLPHVKTMIKLEALVDADNTEQIQQALDKVGTMRADKNGIRGAVLLKNGRYNINSTLYIKHSGVILRGEGKNTCLVATAPRKYTLIKVGESGELQKDQESTCRVIDKYVPSGTGILTLDKVASFQVGDHVIVERPSTKEWISAIGMDNIEKYWRSTASLSQADLEKKRAAGNLSPDGKQYNTTVQWTEGSKNLKFERVIKAIKGNTITLNIPLTNALQQEFGGAIVYKYSYKNRISEVGVENLTAVSLFDSTIIAQNKAIGRYFADENHCWNFIDFVCAQNCWIQNTACFHFVHGYSVGVASSCITIQNCRYIDPVSIIEGGYRYGFTFNGQQNLVVNCYARNGRHDFMLGATVAGPNAFVDSRAEMCHAGSEPHHRWAAGCLWDNCILSGPTAHFSLSNRGRFGSGHGWAGAQMVLWNCETPLAVVMAPPTAMNFSFGTVSLKDQWSSNESIHTRVYSLNKVSKNSFKYEGLPAVGDGFIFSQNKKMTPRSLYYKQLEDRTGKRNKL